MAVKSKSKIPTFAWRMNVNAKAASEGEIYIYDDISQYQPWWGEDAITPKKFKEDLDALGDVSRINVYINSNGGDVFAGQAIHSMLARHKAEVVVYIDGLAASIASVIAMAGDKIVCPVNASIMIHNPWTAMFEWIAGNADYFRGMAEKMLKQAEDLDAIRESLVAAYMKRFKGTREELVALLDAETWLTAERAVELGLADEIEEAKQVAASLRGDMLNVNGAAFDLSRFRNRPQTVVAVDDTPGAETEPPQEESSTSTIASLCEVLDIDEKSIRDAMARYGLEEEKGVGFLDELNRLADKYAVATTSILNGVLAKGRVLSAENEGRITSARDALNEVLNKLAAETDDKKEPDMPMDPDKMPHKPDEEDKNALLDAVKALTSQVTALQAKVDTLVTPKDGVATSIVPASTKPTNSTPNVEGHAPGGSSEPANGTEPDAFILELADEPPNDEALDVDMMKAALKEAVAETRAEARREFRESVLGRVD